MSPACEYITFQVYQGQMHHERWEAEVCCWHACCVWMSYVPHMNDSRDISEWVTLHQDEKLECTVRMCAACKWVMSHEWKSHVSHVNESCPTYEWVMSHIWMIRVPRMYELCLRTYRMHVPHRYASCRVCAGDRQAGRLPKNIGLFCKRAL